MLENDILFEFMGSTLAPKGFPTTPTPITLLQPMVLAQFLPQQAKSN